MSQTKIARRNRIFPPLSITNAAPEGKENPLNHPTVKRIN